MQSNNHDDDDGHYDDGKLKMIERNYPLHTTTQPNAGCTSSVYLFLLPPPPPPPPLLLTTLIMPYQHSSSLVYSMTKLRKKLISFGLVSSASDQNFISMLSNNDPDNEFFLFVSNFHALQPS